MPPLESNGNVYKCIDEIDKANHLNNHFQSQTILNEQHAILPPLSSQQASTFCSVFNQSLRLGIMPNMYKEANVCPVPKKGDLSIATNYRPISLLNAESKVFGKKKTIFKHLYNHLHVQGNNMLSSFQSGFIPGDSTVNQLAFLYHIFCEALDS